MRRDATRVVHALCGIAVCAAAVGGSSPATAAPTAVPSGAQFLVASSPGARLPSGAQRVAALGGLRFSTVRVPAGASARDVAAGLARRAGVAGVQPNTPVEHTSIAGTCVDAPTAPLLETTVTANARSRPLPATTRPIAVLDTGVDPAVRELAGRVLPASSAITGPATGLADDDGHGTQVAAAAAGATGLVAGISPTSPIMPIRVATASVLATPASIVRGLEIAVNRRARVAVLPMSEPLSQTAESSVTSVQLAVNAAFSAGVITVVPAGNEGRELQVFPGGLAHVLTVGSAGRLPVRDPFSNTGPWLDLVAPGADLVLPAPQAICTSAYARASGTSFSAAAVAGAVALLGAARPSLTTGQLFDLVRRSASADTGLQGFDVNTGFGRLDVGAGLTAEVPADDPREVNDNVYWLKRRPRSFPTYLRRTSKTTTSGSVSPGKDPQDAFKVDLRRNDVLRARIRNTDAASVLYASVWSPGTGPFDMRLPAPKSELSAVGFTQNPDLSYRAPRTGTYYVAVFAPERAVPVAGGGPGEDLLTRSPPHTGYRLTLEKRCSTTRTLRVPLTALRRRGRTMTALVVYDNGRVRAQRSRGGIARRITLRGLRNGRHRIVFKARFINQPRKSSATMIRTRCKLRLSR